MKLGTDAKVSCMVGAASFLSEHRSITIYDASTYIHYIRMWGNALMCFSKGSISIQNVTVPHTPKE